MAALTDDQLERYSRHLILRGVGAEGQKRLLASSVLIIGAGGLGSPAAMYLAAAGVGRIGLADGDTVDLSNLQRQIIHTTARVGEPKVESAAAAIRAINPDVTVETHDASVDAGNIADLIAGYDLVIDATDNFAAKFLINDACVLAGKPFVHAGVVGFAGQVMTVVPGEGPCYRCIFRDMPAAGEVPSCREAGVLGAVVGVIGSLEATEALKLIIGVGEPLVARMLTVDALTMNIRRVPLPSHVPDCPVCGVTPTITAIGADRYIQPACAIPDAEPSFRRITPAEFDALVASGPDGAPDVTLLDLREPADVAAFPIRGAVSAPLDPLAQVLRTVPTNRRVVVYCAEGWWSEEVAGILADRGYDVASLEGGFRAYREYRERRGRVE